VAVFGHDWGAVLGYALAAKYPDKVDALVTLAVPHNANRAIRSYPAQVRLTRFPLPLIALVEGFPPGASCRVEELSSVARVSFLHKAHLAPQLRKSWYIIFFQLPVLPELWFGWRWHGLTRLWRDWSPGHSPPQAVVESIKRTFAQPGVGDSDVVCYPIDGMEWLAERSSVF
jgi:pimeloyl-ACP methyl ester carboxylesterase